MTNSVGSGKPFDAARLVELCLTQDASKKGSEPDKVIGGVAEHAGRLTAQICAFITDQDEISRGAPKATKLLLAADPQVLDRRLGAFNLQAQVLIECLDAAMGPLVNYINKGLGGEAPAPFRLGAALALERLDAIKNDTQQSIQKGIDAKQRFHIAAQQ